MQTTRFLLFLAIAAGASACDTWGSPETLLAPEDAAAASGALPASAHVTGDFVVPHSWPTIEWSWWQIDAGIERDGAVSGRARVMFAYSPDCPWCPASHVWFPQEPVCLAFDPASRQAWLGFYMWVEDWQADHWFIVQVQDLAPAAKPDIATEHSRRIDRVAFRSQMSSEPPDFCLTRPDLPQIPVSEYGLPAVDLLPIRSGDVRIHGGG